MNKKKKQRKLLWTREEVRQRLDQGLWAKARNRHLKLNPTCIKCEQRGFTTEATDVDHIIPKRETQEEMWYDPSNLQSLCKPCHDVTKREEENYGFNEEIGEDGWPKDERHPVNSSRGRVYNLEDYRNLEGKQYD